MLNIHIEKVIYDDLEAINDISIDHWGDEGNYGFKRLKHLSDKGYSFCLKNNNEIVAFCIVDIDDDKCEIYLLAVKKGNEGKGYGTAIFGYAIQYARNNGFHLFTLHVNTSNKAAIHLYKKFDFKVNKYIKEYYSSDDIDNNDAYLMIHDDFDNTFI